MNETEKTVQSELILMSHNELEIPFLFPNLCNSASMVCAILASSGSGSGKSTWNDPSFVGATDSTSVACCLI